MRHLVVPFLFVLAALAVEVTSHDVNGLWLFEALKGE